MRYHCLRFCIVAGLFLIIRLIQVVTAMQIVGLVQITGLIHTRPGRQAPPDDHTIIRLSLMVRFIQIGIRLMHIDKALSDLVIIMCITYVGRQPKSLNAVKVEVRDGLVEDFSGPEILA